MTAHRSPEPALTLQRPPRSPAGLPFLASPQTLRQEVRARILDQPDTWHDMAGDGRWLADQLWPHWAAILEPYDVTNDHLARVVAGYRRELWLWVVGERTWEHTLTALAGRLLRRAPGTPQRSQPRPDRHPVTTTPHADHPQNFAQRLVAAAGDAIVIADPDGRILTWNKGAETMFGYTAAEALGNSLDLIIPEKLRARHNEGYNQTMNTGVTRYADDLLAVPAMRADGTRISIEFRVTLLPGPDQKPAAIGAVIRDVTTRWQTDRELRQELTRLRALANPPSRADSHETT